MTAAPIRAALEAAGVEHADAIARFLRAFPEGTELHRWSRAIGRMVRLPCDEMHALAAAVEAAASEDKP